MIRTTFVGGINPFPSAPPKPVPDYNRRAVYEFVAKHSPNATTDGIVKAFEVTSASAGQKMIRLFEDGCVTRRKVGAAFLYASVRPPVGAR